MATASFDLAALRQRLDPLLAPGAAATAATAQPQQAPQQQVAAAAASSSSAPSPIGLTASAAATAAAAAVDPKLVEHMQLNLPRIMQAVAAAAAAGGVQPQPPPPPPPRAAPAAAAETAPLAPSLLLPAAGTHGTAVRRSSPRRFESTHRVKLERADLDAAAINRMCSSTNQLEREWFPFEEVCRAPRDAASATPSSCSNNSSSNGQGQASRDERAGSSPMTPTRFQTAGASTSSLSAAAGPAAASAATGGGGGGSTTTPEAVATAPARRLQHPQLLATAASPFADVVFELRDGQTVLAVAALLAARSPVFAALLQTPSAEASGSMLEKTLGVSTPTAASPLPGDESGTKPLVRRHIKMLDVDPGLFQQLVRYATCGLCDVEPDKAAEMRMLALEYGFEALAEACLPSSIGLAVD